MTDYRKYITIRFDQFAGQPCIRNLRVTVSEILDYLSAGDTIEQILQEFPMLTKEDIMACKEYEAIMGKG
jgi:uncharacterized protein (DUF433 family)